MVRWHYARRGRANQYCRCAKGHVCAPSWVERLVSPIFTKVAQLWILLEEQFRGLDTPPPVCQLRRPKIPFICRRASSYIGSCKVTFVSIADVFWFTTNHPLLCQLFASLFHPLAPNAEAELMTPAKTDVACKASNGIVVIRVDPMDVNRRIECPSDRSACLFGSVTVKNVSREPKWVPSMTTMTHVSSFLLFLLPKFLS